MLAALMGERARPWWFLAGVLLVACAQLVVPAPVVYGDVLVMACAAVVLARTSVVAWLAGAAFVTGTAAALLRPDGAEAGVWVRVVWFGLFLLLTVGIAALEERRRARLVATAGLLTQLLEATDQPVFAKRFPGRHEDGGLIVLTNSAWSRAVDVEPGRAEGRYDRDLLPPEMLDTFRAAERQVLSAGQPVTVEQQVEAPGGARTFLTTLFPIPGDDKVPPGVGGIATDVTDRVQAERRLAAVFARSPVPTLRLVTGGARRTVVLDVNEAVTRLLGSGLVGADAAGLAERVHPDDVAETWALVDLVVEQARRDGPADLLGREVRLVDPAGDVRWVILSVSAVGGPEADGEQELILQFEDITSRKQAEAALTERALVDSVTGLPNRYALTDRLAMALARLGRHPGTVCVLFCDLDRFKEVNDAFGHDAGDGLLVEVARRLTGAVRPQDTVCRHGGDEFVVVCEGLADPVDAAVLAGRLQDRLRAPWTFAGHEFHPAASIGVAFTDDPACSAGDLLRQADVAMYRAKDSGRDRIEVYDRTLDDELAEALAMQQRLRGALADDGVVVHYQPIVRLADRSITAVEALVRLRSDDGVLLPPSVFLPHAETSGLMSAVGDRVLATALRDLQTWRAAGHDWRVGVNVSPTQLVRPELVSRMLRALERAGVDPSWLVVEVTETALVNESSIVARSLERLHSAGARIALDDFGTGYSSLSWLHQFPVDIVKIDRSFVQTMADDHRRAVVVRAVLDIADETGLGVVAEGVETERQAAMLLELGCGEAQGWLFGRPVAADDPSWASSTPAGV